MMKKNALLTLALLASAGTVLAAQTTAEWPANATNENDPRVLAFYQARCNQWADEKGLEAEARSSYLENCLQAAPQVWPVGEDRSE